MASTPNNFSANNQLSTAAQNIIGTVAAGSQAIVRKLSFYNSSATDSRLVTVYIVQISGSAVTTNILVEKSIPPLKTWNVIAAQGEVLEPGMTLQARQDAGADVNSNLSGNTVT